MQQIHNTGPVPCDWGKLSLKGQKEAVGLEWARLTGWFGISLRQHCAQNEEQNKRKMHIGPFTDQKLLSTCSWDGSSLHHLLPTTAQQEQKLLPEEELIICYCRGGIGWCWGSTCAWRTVISLQEVTPGHSWSLQVNAVSCTSAAKAQHPLWVWWILAVLTRRWAAQH